MKSKEGAILTKAILLVIVFVAMISNIPSVGAAEENEQIGESGSRAGATVQSADGEKDVRNMGEAGGGGQSSGNMPAPESTSPPPAESPEAK